VPIPSTLISDDEKQDEDQYPKGDVWQSRNDFIEKFRTGCPRIRPMT
jgi:hypothetical protein